MKCRCSPGARDSGPSSIWFDLVAFSRSSVRILPMRLDHLLRSFSKLSAPGCHIGTDRSPAQRSLVRRLNLASSALLALGVALATSNVAAQSLPTAKPEQVGMSAEKLMQIDSTVQKFIDDRQLAGAVTIVARRGKVVHFEKYGMRDIEANQPMERDTLFRIYSMTKAVVSVAAMMLYEEGKLEIDAPASKYIPALGRMKVGDGQKSEREITVRDLLRHTSGLPNNVTVDRTFRNAGLPPLSESTLAEMMDRLDVVPLIYQPGKDWHYSFAADVVARLVEVASSQLIDEFLSERIFQPLGMKDTAFYVPPEKHDRFAVVYGDDLEIVQAQQPGTTGPFTFEEPPKFLSGGGGLLSTAADYMRFCLMLSGKGEFDGKRLLKEQTVEMMIRNQLPEGVGPISRRPEGRGFGLGFAVRIEKIDSEPSSLGEYEWLGGAGTEFWLSPRDELAVITLSQSLPMRQLGRAIKPIVYDAILQNSAVSELAPAPNRDRYLLLDSRIVEKTHNAKLTPGTVEKHENNPLFVADKPWEPRYDNLYPNVIYDKEDKLYKCWYCPFIVDERTTHTPLEKRNPESTNYMEAKPNRRDEALLYATSKDGIFWEKPELGIVEFQGSTRNNIVVRGPSGAGVYKDPGDPNPARRYKAFYAAQVGFMQLVRFSPDGLHWGPEIKCPEIEIESDCHANMIWSPERQTYIGIVRHYDNVPIVGNRKIARTESPDAVKWTKSTLAIEGTPMKQAHDMVIFRDGGIYLGLLGVMHFPSMNSRHGVRQHIELVWSPDSITWHRIAEGTPLIDHPPSKEKKYGSMPYDWGAMFPSKPVFQDSEKIKIYYGASDWYFFDWRKSGLALATLRRDGWAGYEPIDEGNSATITTVTLVCSGATLRLSADISKVGSVQATVLDGNNNLLATAEPITRTVTDAGIEWPEWFSLQKFKGKKIRLRFEVKSAKLYSFSFGE